MALEMGGDVSVQVLERQRWEDEVKRLESAQNCAIVQHEDL